MQRKRDIKKWTTLLSKKEKKKKEIDHHPNSFNFFTTTHPKKFTRERRTLHRADCTAFQEVTHHGRKTLPRADTVYFRLLAIRRILLPFI